MTIHADEFDQLWTIVNHYHYTREEHLSLERLVTHIFNNHKDVNCSLVQEGSSLFDLRFHCTYYEYDYDNMYTSNIKAMKSTELAITRAKARDAKLTEDSILFELSLINMEICDFRKFQNDPEITIYWIGKTGLEREVDFRILMTITMGPESVGFGTVGDLLLALQRWDSIADIVANPNEQWVNTLFNHFPKFEEVSWSSHEMRLNLRNYKDPSSDFYVTPMWSVDKPFASAKSLGMFLGLEKPEYQASPMQNCPDFLQCIPRGNGDYVVNYDTDSREWAVVYSPSLGIYYKVTVSSWIGDDKWSNSLLDAYLRKHCPDVISTSFTHHLFGTEYYGPKYFRSLKHFQEDPLVKAADEA